ncbi:DUF418 domain-containing protein [Exilibacterium tricleocarpae]|uniref:DUF418 domain-containing protein n=1 Tax=Exilibacterium tricleocarpae TaxID=2591008 RepID=A0A545TZQ9_9GAMM|nr:DUF418 domain-containing protein [Exilibacterium tricleocarpae]TQV82695.1 DUF418 domain-containing protein [Exilibacterium tricleocarpae]
MSQAITPTVPERLETLDVLRGFALFGIMSVNVFVFAHPVNWFDVSWQEIGPFEYGFELLKLIFVQGKFYSLFAFLFGLGFAMQLASAEQRGESFVLRSTKRMIVLFLIALIHFALIWNGDILKNYALAGLVLLVLYLLKQPLDNVYKRFTGKNKVPRWSIIVAACLILFGPHAVKGGKAYLEAQTITKYEAGHTLTEDEQQFIDAWEKAKLPETIKEKAAKKASQHNMFATQSYSEALAYRIDLLPEKLWQPSFNMFVLGLFLFGAYFGRQRLISVADKNRGLFKKIAIAGFITGMMFNCLFVWAMINMPPQVGTFWSFAINLGKSGAGLCFALMYIAIISLAMLGSGKCLLRWLAPVGRMALTHYLLQSLIGTWVFYGHGLGLMVDVTVISQLGFIIVLFSAQVAFSHWWLRRYRYGPLEWVWRSLTDWQAQPMRLDRSITPPV